MITANKMKKTLTENLNGSFGSFEVCCREANRELNKPVNDSPANR
jgi:hypothetical protein